VNLTALYHSLSRENHSNNFKPLGSVKLSFFAREGSFFIFSHSRLSIIFLSSSLIQLLTSSFLSCSIEILLLLSDTNVSTSSHQQDHKTKDKIKIDTIASIFFIIITIKNIKSYIIFII
jgi:hypothetical protein